MWTFPIPAIQPPAAERLRTQYYKYIIYLRPIFDVANSLKLSKCLSSVDDNYVYIPITYYYGVKNNWKIK
jgi:hypothetical protein